MDTPLFPLQTVLFPGGLLPLPIVEVRYLHLLKRADQSGKPFWTDRQQNGTTARRAHPLPTAELRLRLQP